MIKTEKLGEVKTEMIGDVSTTDVMNVFLRIGWGAQTTSRMDFNPAEDLKAGDGVIVIIEKVYEEPEPETEPAEEAPADETAEALKAEEEKEAPVDETAETSTPETEGGKEDIAEESKPLKAEGGEEDTAEKI